MSLEGFCWLVTAQLTNMNALISGAWSETDIRLPIDIESRGRMEGELLRALTRRSVPNNGGLLMKKTAWKQESNYVANNFVYLVDSCTENVVAFLIPLERKNRSFVLP